jgi:CBS domain-containing protein
MPAGGNAVYTVSQLLRHKGLTVHTIGPDASVLEAARLMNQHRIGSLVVLNDDRPVGIITERDILTRIVATERPPAGTPVRDIMTRDLITCSYRCSLDDLRSMMREKRIRHIPIIEDGRLAGMISIGDVNAAEEQALVETITHLETYITR